MHRVAVVFACAALAGCAATPPPAPVGEVVPPDRVLALIQGNTMRGTTPNGEPYSVYTAADGSQRLRAAAGGRVITDQGRSTVENGLLCSRWTNIRGGQPRCVETRRDGDTFRGYADGQLTSTYTILPGNPNGL